MPSPDFAKSNPFSHVSGQIRLLMNNMLACAVIVGLAVTALASCSEPGALAVGTAETAYQHGVVAYNAHDDAEAKQWFTLAAEQGDAAGQTILGMMYLSGEGVSPDISEGLRWLNLAADQGDAEAQLHVGTFAIINNESVTDEIGSANRLLDGVRWIRLASDQGYGPAQQMLGEMYLNITEMGSGSDWLEERPAELRQDLADVFPKNLDDAIRLLIAAADQGHAGGVVTLGDKYRFGNGVVEDAAEAVRWYRLAAEKGWGQENLGDMYLHGEGVPKSEHEAARWYLLAADQGNADAQFKLGGMYLNGSGLPKDGPEAIRLYTLAADQGHSFALFDLARIYRSGDGVPKNDVLAYKWLNILAALHDDETSRYEREELGRAMTSAQVAEAQRLSSEWKRNTPRALSESLRNVPTE